jgi:preprotein translocase subunit SecB
MDPQKYGALLQGVQLERLYMDNCSAQSRKEKLWESASLSLSLDDKPKVREKTDEGFTIDHEYSLIAKPSGSRAYALKITCTFVLIYSSEQELPDEFIELFSDWNVRLNSWPYFREFVQSMTQRMAIPPLTLPLLK